MARKPRPTVSQDDCDDAGRQRAAIRGLRDVAIRQLRKVIESGNAAASVAAIKVVLEELLKQPSAPPPGRNSTVEINFSLEGVGDGAPAKSA